MAPEMLAGRPQRTVATDVFAFGATLYAVATRRLPFAPGDPAPLAVVDPRRHCAGIPAELADHLLGCLHRDPHARPAGFAAIAGHLEHLHRRLLGAEPPDDPAPDTAQRARAQVNLAQTWLQLGDHQQALAAATAAVAADGRSWRAHHALGLVSLESQRPEEAARHFAAASALAPDEVAPLASSALARWRAGDRDGARERLGRAARLAHDTDRFGELDPVSQLAVELLPERDAYAFVHAVLSAHPHAAMTWNNRAVLMRRMGAPELAVESADEALALNPTYAHAWVQKANALLELGRWADALDAADRALVLDPRLAGAHAARCAALAAAGRLPEARACLERGLAVLPGHELLLRAQRGLR
jgi:tetratricopeptide (TPR) repeat protein